MPAAADFLFRGLSGKQFSRLRRVATGALGGVGLVAALALTGCETAGKAVQSVVEVKDKALEIAGMKKPESEMPEAALPARRIPLHIQASSSLNVSEDGHSLALLMRVYKLRHVETFLAAPYEVFGDAAAEKQRLGEDLVEVREIQLVPNQAVDSLEKVQREAAYIGVVALYLHPAAQHWKAAFDADAAQSSGLSLAAHACALSISKGEPVGPAAEILKAALGSCPRPGT